MTRHQQNYFTSTDNLQLYEQWWRPENPKAVVIIVHGVGEHSSRYTHVAAHLTRHNYAVYTFDLRGHGRSAGDRCFVRSFDEYLADLSVLVQDVRKDESGKPVFMLGHSLWGAIATLFAIQHQHLLNGLALSGPALKLGDDIPPYLTKVSKLIGRWFPKLPTLKLDGNAVSRDPLVVHAYNSDPLNYHGGILAATGAAIIRGTQLIQSRMEVITLPLLIMHGTADRLTNPDGSRQLYTRAQSRHKTLKLYEGLYHEIMNEPEKEQVLADILHWLEDTYSRNTPAVNESSLKRE
jgi:acylglycerol lipase